jgi:hypothetical protein
MKTEELIALLATSADQVPAHTTQRRFALALGIGLPSTALLMLVTMGLRADLMQAAAGWAFWLKLAFTACMAVGGLILTGRLSRPGMKVGLAWVAIVVPLFAVWLAAAAALFAGLPEQRLDMFLGSSWKSCPWSIAALSLPLLMATLWCVKDLAPTRLALAGAAAGLLSGALGALVYALHCTESGAPFIGIWYVIGITIPTLIGAALGPRLLRW